MLKYPRTREFSDQLMSGVGEMEVLMAVAFDVEELDRLKASNIIRDFVRMQEGGWNHAQWEDFLSVVRELGYTLPSEVIGSELEMEKEFYWKVKDGVVPERTEMVAVENAGIGTEAALVYEGSASITKSMPSPDELEPRGPGFPKKHLPGRDLFDPVTALENAVVHETNMDSPLADADIARMKIDADEHPWDNVDFDSLSKEERTEYLKSQVKKKMGDG